MIKKLLFQFPIFISITILFGVILSLSCDGLFPTQSKPDVPADHTQKISGFSHKSGLYEPLDTRNGCMTAACHGNDLKGGVTVVSGHRVVVPSCYECHGAVWEGGGESEREGHDDD